MFSHAEEQLFFQFLNYNLLLFALTVRRDGEEVWEMDEVESVKHRKKFISFRNYDDGVTKTCTRISRKVVQLLWNWKHKRIQLKVSLIVLNLKIGEKNIVDMKTRRIFQHTTKFKLNYIYDWIKAPLFAILVSLQHPICL